MSARKFVKAYRKCVRGFPWAKDGLSQTCKKFSMVCDWSVSDVRERFHGVSTVCRSSVRWDSWVVVGLSKTCKKVSMWCDWSVVVVRERVHKFQHTLQQFA